MISYIGVLGTHQKFPGGPLGGNVRSIDRGGRIFDFFCQIFSFFLAVLCCAMLGPARSDFSGRSIHYIFSQLSKRFAESIRRLSNYQTPAEPTAFRHLSNYLTRQCIAIFFGRPQKTDKNLRLNRTLLDLSLPPLNSPSSRKFLSHFIFFFLKTITKFQGPFCGSNFTKSAHTHQNGHFLAVILEIRQVDPIFF